MKHAKILGMLAVAAAALMALVGSASAAKLTSPQNNQLPVGTVIKATSEHSQLTGSIAITCTHSVVEGEITNAGGGKPTQTVSGHIDYLDFTNCGTTTVSVTENGTLEIHSIGNNTGTVTSNGARVTVLTHGFFTGTTHCIYKTENTHIGTLKGTEHSGNTTATLEINSAPIPQVVTDGLCADDAVWHGDYKVIQPDHLWVD